MQSAACFSPRFLNLQPPPSSSQLRTLRHSLPLASSQSKFQWRAGTIRFRNALKGTRVVSYLPDSAPTPNEISSLPDSSTGNPDGGLVSTATPSRGYSGMAGVDPFRGKAGSVSFCGLTHQVLEERKLVSSPFREDTGSFVWVLAPFALLSSLLLPQLFLGFYVEGFIGNEIIAEIVVSLASEFIFYAGLAAFLSVTDHVQRPYLEFSSKRWSLITGLRGYLSSTFFIMGFKVLAPVMAAYVFWPVLGLPALIAVFPFLLGCAAQFAFELRLEKRNSSCWPLLPIFFEIYRVYQLSKAANFLEKLIYSLRNSPRSAIVIERSGALIGMLAVLQILGVACLWSLTTFLLRLFPSRPVVENY